MEDNYDLWWHHQYAMDTKLERYPRCTHCKQTIQDDDAWEIGNDLYCDSCAKFLFRHDIENYILEEEP